MTMRIYTSTDASAPTLQGVVGGAYSSGWADGSLLNLLDKVLVAGYGTTTNAGWTRSFTGTSKGVFRQGGGCQFYLRVLDDGSLTAGAREAQFYGGETATDVDTLTGQFPTSAQQATYLKFRKSNAASATTRPWVCFADNKTFWLYSWSTYGEGGTDYLTSMHFGDFYSFHTADAYNCCAWGRTTSATLDSTANENCWRGSTGSSIATAVTGFYVARGYSQLSSSVNMSVAAGLFQAASGTLTAIGGSSGVLPFPNNADSKWLLSRLYILDPTTVPTTGLRGYLRGAWGSQHPQASVPRELTVTGVGTLAGRSFKALGLLTGNNGSLAVMETSNTWD